MKKLTTLFLVLGVLLTTFALAFETVDLDKPVVVSAKPEKTYAKAWVADVHIVAASPTSKAFATVTLVPWDGGANILAGNAKQVTIMDIFGKAQKDKDLEDAINSVIKVAEKYK